MDEERIPYFILDAKSLGVMVKRVNEYIKEGYIPQGGISATYDQRASSSYYQAMVLKSENTLGSLLDSTYTSIKVKIK